MSIEKQNQVEEMNKSDPRRSLSDVGAIVGVHQTTA